MVPAAKIPAAVLIFLILSLPKTGSFEEAVLMRFNAR